MTVSKERNYTENPIYVVLCSPHHPFDDDDDDESEKEYNDNDEEQLELKVES